MKITSVFKKAILSLTLLAGATTQAQTSPESAPSTSAQSFLGGMQLSAAVDLYAPFALQNGGPDDERFRIRSGEFSFFGPVDQTFDAQLTVAGHDEDGEFEFAIHEGYVGSTKLIPASRFRVGKFLLGVGRLNQFHQHDWPFISAPKSHSVFFADEAAIDTGLEYSILLPIDFYADITVGVTNGYCYGHCHENGGPKALAPTHYAHPVFFTSLDGSSGLQYGLTYLGRTSPEGVLMRLVGGDLTLKIREGKTLKWLVQSEIYHRYLRPSDLPIQEQIGGYVYTQRGLTEEWSAGLRLDAFTEPSLRFGTGDKRNNLDYALVPVVAYKASEFSTVRLSYTYFNETREGNSDRPEQKIELQLVSILGSHPAHDF